MVSKGRREGGEARLRRVYMKGQVFLVLPRNRNLLKVICPPY
jgi:hypothetical protein